MKVLLAHAYFLHLDAGEQKVMKPYPPLGILYLSAWLKQQGYDVRVFDGTFSSPEAFGETLAHFRPRVVGFYANMMTRHNVLRLRAMIQDPEIRVVVGGPDPPHYADDYLDRGFDAVITGEGERPVTRWLETIDDPQQWRHIEGLVYREAGETIRAPAQKPDLPLDDLPLPDRKAVDIEPYLNCWQKHHGKRPMSLITSRGCPYRCTWCSHNVYGYSLRKRSPEKVIEELDWIDSNYKVDSYWFADDVFTINFKWIETFTRLMKSRPELRKPFECISRADRLNPAMVDCLVQLACARVWVGAESGSQRLLDQMKRGIGRDQVIEAVRGLRRAGIETGMFFMWGFMDEGMEDVLDTIDLAEQCEPDIALTTIGYPIKGTAFHQALADQERLNGAPVFDMGTDRDIEIQGQAGAEVYGFANGLLTAALAEKKALRGALTQKVKAPAWRLRRMLAAHRLRRAFRRHQTQAY
ncbi:MAG: radical SAM protein [Acidobacteriota bacterium]|nr:radical SAM protein [Acidobacteriota bacterium]